jgi:hypothetical protein
MTAKGEIGERVYFEYIRGGASAEQLGERLPDNPFIVFLRESRSWDSVTYTSDDRARGLPESATL